VLYYIGPVRAVTLHNTATSPLIRSEGVEENINYFKKFRTELILVLGVVLLTLILGVGLIIHEGAVFHSANQPSAPGAAMPHAPSDGK
jgi:hypothetical protein